MHECWTKLWPKFALALPGSVARMTRVTIPELKKYMDRRLFLQVNANRRITGILRGYDAFMNLVIDEATEEVAPHDRRPLGLVVLRGNAVQLIEIIS